MFNNNTIVNEYECSVVNPTFLCLIYNLCGERFILRWLEINNKNYNFSLFFQSFIYCFKWKLIVFIQSSLSDRGVVTTGIYLSK